MEGGASLDRWTVTSLENIKREPRGFVFNIVEIDKKLPKQEKNPEKTSKKLIPTTSPLSLHPFKDGHRPAHCISSH